MPQQRPFFLSSFLAAFRQQPPAASPLTASSQPNKSHQSTSSTSYSSPSSSGARTTSTSASQSTPQRTTGGVMNQLPLHSPRTHGMPIPGSGSPGRRRGSDSSTEGFRDVLGNEKWYIGGRTAAGEEKFFKLGVVKRARSNDRLSLDKLSL